MKCLALLLLLCVSCNSLPSSRSSSYSSWQAIPGRDQGNPLERIDIYRAKVPDSWKRVDPSEIESIAHSTLPNVTYLIEDSSQQIRITIHTFPYTTLEERIPPAAQVARWKGQFAQIDPTSEMLKLDGRGGFAGLFLELSGHLKAKSDELITMLAWAMQLDPQHFLTLLQQSGPYYDQMRSDYTIKAVGPAALIERYKEEVISFANSFELIQAIPSTQ